jgi:predicted enzyme related to lactoylglutathione lyase
MDFASIRMITDDLEPVVQFYEQITGASAVRPAPVFAGLSMPSCTLALGQAQTAQLFENAADPADNHAVIIEFQVDDVDKEYERLKTLVSESVLEPPTMPWRIDPCCCAIPTATSSKSSLPSPTKQSRGSTVTSGNGRPQQVGRQVPPSTCLPVGQQLAHMPPVVCQTTFTAVTDAQRVGFQQESS